ncbi:MAG: CHASE2 domain-containing protein [Methylococcaceae bacterium]|nr:CHASE2 domain-containing protein [Methylococcaceae bacterium]
MGWRWPTGFPAAQTLPVEPDQQSRARERKIAFALGATLTLAWCLAGLCFPDLLERAENVVADRQVGLLPEHPPSREPVIVEVDEASLRAFGQWPWPRYQVAKLLESISEAGAVGVGVDALFAERDRTSPAEIARALQRDFNQYLTLEALPPPQRDYDRILAAPLAQGPFVLGYFLSFDKTGSGSCTPKSASGAILSAQDGDGALAGVPQATGLICSIPILGAAAAYAGFTNGLADDDGLYRRTPLIARWNGGLYPSLALQTFLTATGIQQFVVDSSASGLRLRLGDLIVPLDATGNLLIRFRNHRYESISAADVMAGKVLPDRLRGKMVLLGFSAAGLHEYRPNPLDPLFTGVQLHAAVLDNLANRNFLQRPAFARALEAIVALLLGWILALLLARAGPTASALWPATLITAVVGSSQFLLSRYGLVVSPVLPTATLILVLLALSLLKFGREYLRSQRLARQIADGQDAIIEGFCTMSEYRDPETGFHIRRTQNYVKALALRLRQKRRYRRQLDDAMIELLYKTAPLHDIGKIGIRDQILLKPDRLTDEEFAVMKTHTTIGGEVVQAIQAHLGPNAFLETAAEIILGHQEKWDGSGYPRALKGEEIPLAARLMALADVYDALISRRVYKPGFPHRQAVELIAQGSGQHFDPELVNAFLDIHEEFRDIALRFLDDDEQRQTLLGEAKTD